MGKSLLFIEIYTKVSLQERKTFVKEQYKDQAYFESQQDLARVPDSLCLTHAVLFACDLLLSMISW